MKIEKLQEYFMYAFKNLKQRKMRTWLTMIGIFIGVAAVVSLISLGTGLQKTVDEQFSMLGTDKIIITGAGTLMGLGDSARELTKDDLEVVKKTRGVQEAMGGIYTTGEIKLGRETNYMLIYSAPTDESRKIWEEIGGIELKEGRWFKKGDKQKAMVGYYFEIEDKIFEETLKTGKKLTINGEEFDIIAIFEPIGNPQDDSNIMLPEDYMRELINEPDKEDYIMVRTIPGEDVAKVADRIEDNLREYHNLEEGNEFFQVETSLDLMDTYTNILDIVNGVLIGIAIISLIVGGIGIMNTMFTSVLQRTTEIGIMKSVGAKNSDILTIFLIESGMLGIAGGIIGILLGIGISELVAIIAEISLETTLFQAYAGPELIIGALLFSFLIGSISGILPAIKASKMNAIDAIQYKK